MSLPDARSPVAPRRPLRWVLLVAVIFTGNSFAFADEPVKPRNPIKALLVTGGCCHDYSRQKLILTRGISARADVEWTVVQQGGTSTSAKIPLYEDADWAKGFDVIVHNECFADVKDVEWVERILKPHREGTPAVLIHCAMHCYRTGTDKWFEFCGVQSPGHGPHYGYTVENLKTDHPIMEGFGDQWDVAKGELYFSIKLFPNAVPLGQAKRKPDNQPQTCVWTNEYGKARVFATTIGHYNETMVEPTYLDMVTRGLLWAVKREDKSDFRKTDEKTDVAIRELVNVKVDDKTTTQIPGKCCGDGNLAFGKMTRASSEETGKNNFAKNAVDGNLGSRWCANGGNNGQTWQVDLGQAEHIKALRIHWEMPESAYRYKIDASPDGEKWKTVVDQSDNKKPLRITPHDVDATDTRHLRVTFLGSSTGKWASFWEFEAYADKLPPLPAGVEASSAGGGAPASVADVQAPDGFNVTLFGAPPAVNYPVCLSAAPTGELFVGVDEQGSLGKEKGKGKVLRCIDTDGDGQADRINVFTPVDHPRGLIYDNGSLWVLHPPFLSVFHDDNRDNIADRNEVLITGLTTDQLNQRGADHTTNGIRMGIDGWIYIAVGDFGFSQAKGRDGTTLSRRGGGILRVRPDGTEMEVFAWGLRNVLDACIDPSLNIFTRDNTNDGGGWNVRLSHILQTAEYGYPSLFMNFADEIMPPLADYGGGSGCGGMFFHDIRWPAPFGNALYTCDWGRSEVYRHNLPTAGPTFAAHQEVFLKLPRPTDIDVDGSGRMFVASWKNGNFNYTGPDVGFVAQIKPVDFLAKPFPDLAAATDAELVGYLAAPSAVYRLHSQRELLRRRRSESRSAVLLRLAADGTAPLYARVAAIFTLKQLGERESHAALLKLAGDSTVREFALRALTDRKSQLDDLPLEPFLAGLKDKDPRVQVQSLISLSRLGRAEAAPQILPLTQLVAKIPSKSTEPLHAQPDPSRVVPHLAVHCLASLGAVEACLQALDGPHRAGALSALRLMHDEKAVAGLLKRITATKGPSARRDLLAALIRLYHVEKPYDKGDWWGTRPDTTGPYYDRGTWPQSERIALAVKDAVNSADVETAEFLGKQLARHKVRIEGVKASVAVASSESDTQTPIAVPKVDPQNPNQIANLGLEKSAERAAKAPGDAERGKTLFTQQSCNACHTDAAGQTPKGPHLVDIGKRYKRPELIESILKPSAKIAQGFDTFSFVMTSGKVFTGFVALESAESVHVRQTTGLSIELPKQDIEERAKQELSMMPDNLVGNLTPEQLADLIAYLESLK